MKHCIIMFFVPSVILTGLYVKCYFVSTVTLKAFAFLKIFLYLEMVAMFSAQWDVFFQVDSDSISTNPCVSVWCCSPACRLLVFLGFRDWIGCFPCLPFLLPLGPSSFEFKP